ncbi:MAG: CBS domain-containing protein [Gaiellaceae bacterium]|jgi:CBS domain-containing protein
MDLAVLHLTMLVKSKLVDRSGDTLGRIEDLIVRLADGAYPPVTGLKARVAGRELFVAAKLIGELKPGRVQLAGDQLNLGRFERRPREVLLSQDVLGHRLINVAGARLARASDIELAFVDGAWRVVGVDVSLRGPLRQLLPRRLGGRGAARTVLDWASVEPFVGHVPSSRLRMRFGKLAQLHPAQIADLVEAASHEEGEEIIRAVGADRELEADVFEELDPEHQVEFLHQRSDAEAANVLAKMGADDAADLLAELDQERREPVLSLLPKTQQRKVRTLLGFNPSTAGGLMNPDFLCLSERISVKRALEEVKRSGLEPEQLNVVFTCDSKKRLSGALAVAALVRADPETRLADIVQRKPVSLHPDADLPEVARELTDFNLTALPVVNEHEQVIGVVAVDDVLELIFPEDWRRRFAAFSGE